MFELALCLGGVSERFDNGKINADPTYLMRQLAILDGKSPGYPN